MSIHANVLTRAGLMNAEEEAREKPEAAIGYRIHAFDPQSFAREQIRTLVRRVFPSGAGQAVRQVVFCAAEARTDISSICEQVGHALALEASGDVAIVSRDFSGAATEQLESPGGGPEKGAIKSWASRLAPNLWCVPETGLRAMSHESATNRYWVASLARLREEFEYAVIQGPAAGVSSESALLGQLADGIILVIEAHNTRRATARKIKDSLQGGQSRILGTVLSERTFPVPEGIYRRL